LTDVRALSRAVSLVEDRGPGYRDVLRTAYANARWPTVIGITGPPGSEKSTLIDELAARWDDDGSRIAILAVDPSSPFSGGAVLGDRIRMERSGELPNVYVRSLSARGHLGGLNEAACDLIALVGEFGFERVLLETVGAGQSDVEVTSTADCTVVLAVPDFGDSVQALKAGTMEIADVYAVNKSDRPGAESTRQQIEGTLGVVYSRPAGVGNGSRPPAQPPPATPGIRALMRRHGDPRNDVEVWRPPVVPVSARSGEGIGDLAVSIDRFVEWSGRTGRLSQKREQRIRDQVLRLLARRLLEPYQSAGPDLHDGTPDAIGSCVDAILAGTADPCDAVDGLLARGAFAGRGNRVTDDADDNDEYPASRQ